jgi:gas vesicle protein
MSGSIAFLAGLAIGAALGVLLAPESGEKTRATLRTKGREAKDELDDLIDEGREKWRDVKGKASDAATMTHDEVDEFVRFLFQEGMDLWDRVKDDGGRVKDEARKSAD